MKRLLLIICTLMICLCISHAKGVQFVDLGLPSGTKWGSFSERGAMMWADAIEKYGTAHIPTAENYKELFEHCSVQVDIPGTIVTAPYFWAGFILFD